MYRVRFLNCFLASAVFLIFTKNICASSTTQEPSNEEPGFHSIRRNPSERFFDAEQIEYRLTKLEVKLDEKSERLVSELREGNRRLRALEYEDSEVRTALEELRIELARLSQSSSSSWSHHRENHRHVDDKLESRVDDLQKGVQLAVAALRALISDISWVRKNVSSIVSATSTLLQQHQDLATKQFLANSLLDMKHDQRYPSIQSNLFTVPRNISSKSSLPRHCRDVQDSGVKESGIYQIQPEHAHKPFMVLCDMETKDGGWTYIQNRYEGFQDFFLNWHEYKTGFGNLGGEFWLGLEYIYQLTGHEINELLIELVDAEGEKALAHYAAFGVGSEAEGYALKVLGGYSGDAGDSLKYHAGSRFSTKDLDQDGWVEGNCAQAHNGGWWYRGCDTSNLNGKYLNGELPESYLYQGMYWGEFRGPQYSLSRATMMIRPRDGSSPPVFPAGLAGNRKG